ncbi:O-antigen ligase family protein [Leptolyngbya ohadii]|uniref:O-antigen ligase family protein n=1 Tax=Leptolyngbya ohadii TaxID=1962290 RepID=UPI000B5A0E46|nr:O-antigen ligase family protein [Leptolyngbya ohadii]
MVQRLSGTRENLFDRLFRGSMAGFLYLHAVSMVGIAAAMGYVWRRGKAALDPITRNSLWVLSGLLVLSSLFAYDRGEAFLQLIHFLPFFLLFAVLPYFFRSTERLALLTTDWVIATIPINLYACLEAALKADSLPRSLRRIPVVRWVRSAPHAGRAMMMFNHPNSVAVYLVVILALGLGVLYYQTVRDQKDGDPKERQSGDVKRSPSLRQKLLYVGTYSTLLGIFSSGSRNGLLIAVLLILVFSVINRSNRVVLTAGLVSLGGMVAGAIAFGVGGRSISLNWLGDSRLRIWRIAGGMIQERPWLGWGLGNFKFLYVDRLLNQFPQCEAQREVYRVIPVECADASHPHNFWLLLTSEAGFLVAIGFTLFIGWLCFRAGRAIVLRCRQRRIVSGKSEDVEKGGEALLTGYLLAVLAFSLFSLFDVTYHDIRVNLINWVALGGMYALTSKIGSS